MKKQRWAVVMFVLPVTVLLLGICIYPFCSGVGMGFTNYNLLRPGKERFVGFENITKILTTDTEFWHALGFSVFYALMTVLLSYIFGLVCALLMNKPIKGKNIFRALLLLPWVVPTVVAANTWIWILNAETGLINNFLQSLHLIKEPILFLSDTTIVKITAMVIGAWKNFPFMMLVILAGLQSIPSEVYESAYVDGANKWKTFFHITFPLLKSVTMISTVLMVIWTFSNFDLIYLLTKGGPVDATMTISIYAYNTAFFRNDMGYASAISVVMMGCMMIMCGIYMKLLKRE